MTKSPPKGFTFEHCHLRDYLLTYESWEDADSDHSNPVPYIMKDPEVMKYVK